MNQKEVKDLGSSDAKEGQDSENLEMLINKNCNQFEQFDNKFANEEPQGSANPVEMDFRLESKKPEQLASQDCRQYSNKFEKQQKQTLYEKTEFYNNDGDLSNINQNSAENRSLENLKEMVNP